ncbi:MAG TPA: hypothetical protein VHN37_09925 [Actinomycetota bacterium]|nr:hypothetical protein [Actinomycetota bacterium]
MDRSNASPDGLSRRRFLRHAVVAAWASPLIVSMASRSAAAAGPRTCGTKIGGAGTTACRVTTPCGAAAAVGCKASPAAPAGSPCYCI